MNPESLYTKTLVWVRQFVPLQKVFAIGSHPPKARQRELEKEDNKKHASVSRPHSLILTVDCIILHPFGIYKKSTKFEITFLGLPLDQRVAHVYDAYHDDYDNDAVYDDYENNAFHDVNDTFNDDYYNKAAYSRSARTVKTGPWRNEEG